MIAQMPPFYITGGALDPEDPSYVVRQADEELLTALRQGALCYVLTARQMGKSSLMVRTAQRLRQMGTAVAILDLQMVGRNLTPTQWYAGLLDCLGRALESSETPGLRQALRDFWRTTDDQRGPLQRWLEALHEIVLTHRRGPVVLFVDEVDYVRNLGFATDEFFAGIRACYNQRAEDLAFRRLTFCLVGVATPPELIQDPKTTPFNIGRRIELTDFTPTEAAPLATGLGCPPPQGTALLRRILAWTGGHPYLTQRLCQAVVDAGDVTTPAGVDRVCAAVFLAPLEQEADNNLLSVQQRLLGSDVDRASLLTLYAQVRRGQRIRDNEKDPLINELRLAGITRVEQGRLRVRNRIYARVFDRAWIRSQMPGAELIARRAAFWRGVMSTAAVVLLLAGVGVWVWDAYYRPQVVYYAQVHTRWGLPEGVGRLTAKQVRRRNTSLAFHKHGRRGPVHEIRLVNSRGAYPPLLMSTSFLAFVFLNPRPVEPGTLPETMVVSRVAFEYAARDKILNQVAYNRAGRPLYTLHYVHPNRAEYRTAAWASYLVSPSGIEILTFVRPEHGPEAGLTTEVRFFDKAEKPQPGPDGTYGSRYILDARGLPVKEIYLGKDGQPGVSTEGIATGTLTYDALGNVTQVAHFGRDGQPILDDSGSAGMRCTYDSYGNLQEVVFLGTDGQLVTVPRAGAAGRSLRYDAHGNVVETAFFDPQRQPVIGRLGLQTTVPAFARQTIVWDGHGGALETYFGLDGTPMVLQGRVVKIRAIWDARGYPLEMSYFDEHERPVYDDDGCAKERFTPDAQGNVVITACLDDAGHPIRSTEGYASVQRVYDAQGNAIESLFLGPTGQPALYDERYVKIRRTYNPQGKQVEEVYFDATDQPVTTKAGYAKVTYHYDLYGNQTEVAFFDAHHQPTARQGNYAKLLHTYDERRRLIVETQFDPQGQPTRGEDGYVTSRFVYNAQGYRSEIAYFDENDRPTAHIYGFAKVQWQYNDQGQVTERAYVGLDGGYTLHAKHGFAKVRLTYNARGQLAQLAYVDAQDRLVQIDYGYAIIRYTYDDLGRETTRLFFDAQEKPVHTRVVVEKVEPDSASQRLGLQVGDLLMSYDGEDIHDTRLFHEWELVKGERQRTLRLQRQGQDVPLALSPGRLTGLTVQDRDPATRARDGT